MDNKGQVKNKFNEISGQYYIEDLNLFYKHNVSNEWGKCLNISDFEYFDLTQKYKMKVKEKFNGVAFLCRKEHSILVFRNDEFFAYKYNTNIDSDDLSLVILNISLYGG